MIPFEVYLKWWGKPIRGTPTQRRLARLRRLQFRRRHRVEIENAKAEVILSGHVGEIFGDPVIVSQEVGRYS